MRLWIDAPVRLPVDEMWPTYDGVRATRGPRSCDIGRDGPVWLLRMNGTEIATEPRRTPQRTRTTATARRATPARATASRATPARKAPARKAPPRPAAPRKRSAPAPYRPSYWLVAAVVVALGMLALVFLVSIMVLWNLAGPLTTSAMVLLYAGGMFALWRVGVSRL